VNKETHIQVFFDYLRLLAWLKEYHSDVYDAYLEEMEPKK
jgi:hypothetical protein